MRSPDIAVVIDAGEHHVVALEQFNPATAVELATQAKIHG